MTRSGCFSGDNLIISSEIIELFCVKKKPSALDQTCLLEGKIQYSSSGAADNHIKSNKDQHVKIVPTDHADGEIVMCRRDNESMQLPA